jgi:hypothetical protein
MLEGTVSIHRDDHVFCDSHALTGPPSDHSGWHRLSHFGVQNERLLACEDIVDTDCSIAASLGQVLVQWIVSDAEGLLVQRSQSVFMGDLDV